MSYIAPRLAAVAVLLSSAAWAEEGYQYTYKAGGTADMDTVITISDKYVSINDDTEDLIVADRMGRKIYVSGPNGALTDVSELMPRMAPAAGAQAGATAGAGASSGNPATTCRTCCPSGFRS